MAPSRSAFPRHSPCCPFFLPEAVPGLAIGCFIANLIGSPIALDWIVGTAATLLAALWTSKLKRRWLAPMPPVLCNMVIVGAEIAWFEGGFTSAFFPSWVFNAATVGLGELLACYILGMLLIGILPRIPYFRGMIPEEQAERYRRPAGPVTQTFCHKTAVCAVECAAAVFYLKFCLTKRRNQV